jgi:hypothetical protein
MITDHIKTIALLYDHAHALDLQQELMTLTHITHAPSNNNKINVIIILMKRARHGCPDPWMR